MKENRYSVDPVLPGEQWFCYWRTSAALWEPRIQEFPRTQRIYIPLYWGFHAEQDGTWDFGNLHPERDLKRLVNLLTRQGREFTFILPLGPSPFLPNGGVPISSARTLSKNQFDEHLATLDQDGVIHKMYSFFEPKVFGQFSSFLVEFNDFLLMNRLNQDVFGARFFYLEDSQYVSFFNDSSFAFEQGFSRYLRKNSPEGVELSEPTKELELKIKFMSEVENLFCSAAEEVLKNNWKKVQEILVLGASPKDTIERLLQNGKSLSKYFSEIFKNFVQDFGISSVLLNKTEKSQLMQECLKRHFSEGEIDLRFGYLPQMISENAQFKADILFEIFDSTSKEIFENSGLINFLTEKSPWMFKRLKNLNFTSESIEEGHKKVKFFHGKDMNRTTFAQMIKLFFMGQKVTFDINHLDFDLRKKLEIFYAENNLKVEAVHFQTQIQFTQLGEGMFIVYDSSALLNSVKKQQLFWNKIFQVLNIKQLSLELPEHVFSFSAVRETSSHELNFLDVRRISLYNPTSYKKQISINTNKSFAFMRITEASKAQAQSHGDSVMIEILPNGSLSLDFGHYEEKR